MTRLSLKARTYECLRDRVAVGNLNRQRPPFFTGEAIRVYLSDHYDICDIAVCPIDGMEWSSLGYEVKQHG